MKDLKLLFENQDIIRKLAKVSEIYIVCPDGTKFLMSNTGFERVSNVKDHAAEEGSKED